MSHSVMPINSQAYTPEQAYTVDVVALQQTLNEACHDMQVAREFTHERTKQWITH